MIALAYFYQITNLSSKETINKSFEILKKLEKNPKFSQEELSKLLFFFDRKMLEDERFEDFIINQFEDILEHDVLGKKIVFAIYNNHKKKTFSQKEIENLKKIESVGRELGFEFGVFDYRDVFSVREVENANNIIKSYANELKKHHYSPLEAYLSSFLKVSERKHKPDENVSKSRSVFGVLNGDSIVCAGYSELLKAVIKEYNDENLKVFANYIITKSEGKDGLHQSNIVFLNDEKYKVKGYYYSDPTFANWQNFSYNTKYPLHFALNSISQIKNNFETYEYKNWYDVVTTNEGECERGLYSSVSAEKMEIAIEQSYADHDKYDDFLLSEHLKNDRYFKEWLILKEVEHKKSKNNTSFDLSFKKVYDYVNKYGVDSLKTYFKVGDLWKFMDENSQNIDIGVIQNALMTVLKKENPQKTRDEISKMVYETLKGNIADSKDITNNMTMTFSECEDLK